MSSKQCHSDAAGEWDGMSRICSFATQCLHNTIFLCDQALPQPTEPSSSHQAPIISAESSEALPNPSSALPNPSSGPQYPSNGHRGRLGTAEGSAAEAAEQLAMLSLDRSRASSGKLVSQTHTLMLNPNANVFAILYVLFLRSCIQHATICGIAIFRVCIPYPGHCQNFADAVAFSCTPACHSFALMSVLGLMDVAALWHCQWLYINVVHCALCIFLFQKTI